MSLSKLGVALNGYADLLVAQSYNARTAFQLAAFVQAQAAFTPAALCKALETIAATPPLPDADHALAATDAGAFLAQFAVFLDHAGAPAPVRKAAHRTAERLAQCSDWSLSSLDAMLSAERERLVA